MFRSIALAGAVAALSATAANAGFIYTQLNSDAEFLALGLDSTFEAQGRLANNANNGDQEFDLGPTTAAPATQAQYTWASGQPVPFSLSYDAMTGDVSFETPAGTLSYTATGAPTYGLAIRTRAEDGSTLLSDLELNGTTIFVDVFSSGGPADVDYLLINEGVGSLASFTLTGDITLTFDELDPPSGSRIAFQIKGVVPTPGAAALAGVVGLAALRRRTR